MSTVDMFENWSYAELAKRNEELMRQVEKVRQEKRCIQQAMDLKVARGEGPPGITVDAPPPPPKPWWKRALLHLAR